MARQRAGLDGTAERAHAAGRERVIAGIDEVGRGPLAGPVVVAAVILDPANIPPGLGDSKTIARPRRYALHDAILGAARAVAIASTGAEAIDATNIRRATLDAMRRAVAGLAIRPELILVDGRDLPDCGIDGWAIIRGDATVASIAAASIVAKVVRDRMMARLDSVHPGYNFSVHSGYGTLAHREAIAMHGPCPAHRFSFAPIRGNWQRG
jgi:ribonuclease HII